MRRFFTIGNCSRTIGCCFPYCFLEIFVRGDKAVIDGDIVVMGIPQSPPPTRRNLEATGQYLLSSIDNLIKLSFPFISLSTRKEANPTTQKLDLMLEI